MSDNTDLDFYNIEVEQSLLGLILLNNNIYEEISDKLSAYCFYDTINHCLYEIITKLLNSSQEASIVTVSHFCKYSKNNNYASITPEYLLNLTKNVTSLGSHISHTKIIHDLYLKRQILLLKNNINKYLEDNPNPMSVIGDIEKDIFKLSEVDNLDKSIETFEESLAKAYESALKARELKGGLSGFTTGIKAIDTQLGGLQKSDLIILAGRPAMGKTALATNIAFNCARSFTSPKSPKEPGAPVAIFSLEMSSEQIASRILSSQAGISSDALRKGIIDDMGFNRLTSVMQELAQIQLFIDDTPGLSITQLRTRCRRLKRKHNIGLIIIDYVQLLSGENKNYSSNRTLEISEITRGLKGIAKELNIPVIALSQLSRSVESREDKKPLLADLRESGSIEQDADIVSFVFREEYYIAREEPTTQKNDETMEQFETRKNTWHSRYENCKGKATLIIAKNRHGSIANIDLAFQSQNTLFTDLAVNLADTNV